MSRLLSNSSREDLGSGSSISYLYKRYKTFQALMMFNYVEKLGIHLGGYTFRWNRTQLEGVSLFVFNQCVCFR
jgi:hypothetical protein